MAEEVKHTPVPWGIEQTEGRNWIGPMRPNDGKVDRIVFWNDRGGEVKPNVAAQRDADAAHVVRCVNCHDDLLAACRPVLAEANERADYMHDTWNPEAHVELTLTIAELRAIRAAVAKAEGK